MLTMLFSSCARSKMWKFTSHTSFLIILLCFPRNSVEAASTSENDAENSSDSKFPFMFLMVGFSILITSVLFVTGCLWCVQKFVKEQRNFQEFENTPSEVPTSAVESGYTEDRHDQRVVIEPLPDLETLKGITLSPPLRPRPADFNSFIKSWPDLEHSQNDWFENERNFPRKQLHYIREMGTGWFGQAIEGEAKEIVKEKEKEKVIVKAMKNDSTRAEQMYFLNEMRPFKNLNHPHILKVVGQCLETNPYLLIIEFCELRDMKSYLRENCSRPEGSVLHRGLLLRMACDMASGLNHMHANGFMHQDFAARNCMLNGNLSVKVGDYGVSQDLYKEDYYNVGDYAVPIRWCAPEIVSCVDSLVTVKENTIAANVWSFGVALWELLVFGQQPYSHLQDAQVIDNVLRTNSVKLSEPTENTTHCKQVYDLVTRCCSPDPKHRPLMDDALTTLTPLNANRDKFDVEDFETRWNSLRPNMGEVDQPFDFKAAGDEDRARHAEVVLAAGDYLHKAPVIVDGRNVGLATENVNAKLSQHSPILQPPTILTNILETPSVPYFSNVNNVDSNSKSKIAEDSIGKQESDHSSIVETESNTPSHIESLPKGEQPASGSQEGLEGSSGDAQSGELSSNRLISDQDHDESNSPLEDSLISSTNTTAYMTANEESFDERRVHNWSMSSTGEAFKESPESDSENDDDTLLEPTVNEKLSAESSDSSSVEVEISQDAEDKLEPESFATSAATVESGSLNLNKEFLSYAGRKSDYRLTFDTSLSVDSSYHDVHDDDDFVVLRKDSTAGNSTQGQNKTVVSSASKLDDSSKDNPTSNDDT